MNLVEMKLSELKEAPYNPRVRLKEGTPEYEKLRRSIEDFGDVEPVVWNKTTGHVVGGEQRLSVMRGMGRDTALVSVVEMSEHDEKLLNVALNKIKGEWDDEKLHDLFETIDFSSAINAGFNADEIALINAFDESEEGAAFDSCDDDEDVDFYGDSFVTVFVFPNASRGREWCEAHGVEASIKDGFKSAVVRMEDNEA